jgi:heme-degrading monooxygenase HmoA
MFLVVFRNRKRPDIDPTPPRPDSERPASAAAAAAMRALAAAQPGYLGFKSYTADDGEVIALSEWQDEAAARAWGRVAEHRAAQQRGRSAYYAEYTLYACNDPHIRRFTAADEA